MFNYESKKKNNIVMKKNSASNFSTQQTNNFASPFEQFSTSNSSVPSIQPFAENSTSNNIIQCKTLGKIANANAVSQYDTRHTSGGRSLPKEVKTKMERAFNTDFSQVRIHTDSKASAINAKAYAQGHNVHVAPEYYHPHTQAGQQLIGHELAHVVQQRQGKVHEKLQANGLKFNQSDHLEKEADHAGALAAAGKTVSSQLLNSSNVNFNSQINVIQKAPKFKPTVFPYPKVVNPNVKNSRIEETGEGNYRENNVNGNLLRTQQRAKTLEALIDPNDYNSPGFGKATVGNVQPLGTYWATLASTSPSMSNPKIVKSSWVKFHLLNADLGGDGSNYLHLVPTTSKANNAQGMWGNFEKQAKGVVAGNKFLHYYIKVTYLTSADIPGVPNIKRVHDYIHFFPKTIAAEFTPIDTNKAHKTEKITLAVPNTLALPPEEVGEVTLALNQITDDRFANIYGLKLLGRWLHDLHSENNFLDRIVTKKVSITMQDFYEEILATVRLKTFQDYTLSAFNREWKKFEDLITKTNGTRILLGARKITTSKAKLKIDENSLLSAGKMWESLSRYNGTLKQYINDFNSNTQLDSNNKIWEFIIKEIRNNKGETELQEHEIYDSIMSELGAKKMMEEYDDNWEDYMSKAQEKINFLENNKNFYNCYTILNRYNRNFNELNESYKVYSELYNKLNEIEKNKIEKEVNILMSQKKLNYNPTHGATIGLETLIEQFSGLYKNLKDNPQNIKSYKKLHDNLVISTKCKLILRKLVELCKEITSMKPIEYENKGESRNFSNLDKQETATKRRREIYESSNDPASMYNYISECLQAKISISQDNSKDFINLIKTDVGFVLSRIGTANVIEEFKVRRNWLREITRILRDHIKDENVSTVYLIFSNNYDKENKMDMDEYPPATHIESNNFTNLDKKEMAIKKRKEIGGLSNDPASMYNYINECLQAKIPIFHNNFEDFINLIKMDVDFVLSRIGTTNVMEDFKSHMNWLREITKMLRPYQADKDVLKVYLMFTNWSYK